MEAELERLVKCRDRLSMQVTRVSVGGRQTWKRRKIGKETGNHPEPVSDTELQGCKALGHQAGPVLRNFTQSNSAQFLKIKTGES